MKVITAALAVLFLALGATTCAQPGSLDATFGTNGKVTTDFGNGYAIGYSVAIQPDGKIVVAGTSENVTKDFALARYNTDGTLDNSFGAGGQVTTDFETGFDVGNAMAIQHDGRIIVAGYSITNEVGSDFALARYNTDGTLDNTFGVDGKVITDLGTVADELASVAIQADGKIIVAGWSGVTDYDFALARYNTDGTLDNSFGTSGIVTTDFGMSSEMGYSVAIQPDGRIIVAGTSNSIAIGPVFALARYNVDGTLDNSFSGDGKVTTDFGAADTYIRSVAIQPDGRIIAAGFIGNGPSAVFAVVRYNTDGTLDNTFGAAGKVTTDLGTSVAYGYSVSLQPDGKFVVAGSSLGATTDLALARFNTDGTFDSSFGVNGIVTTDFGQGMEIGYSVALQPDWKIVVAGYTSNGTANNFAVARYLSGLNIGVVEFSLTNNAPLIYPNPIKEQATLKYTLQNAETISIELLDMQGKTVQTFIEGQQQAAGAHQQAIDLPEALPAGSYLIAISSPKGRFTVQVVK